VIQANSFLKDVIELEQYRILLQITSCYNHCVWSAPSTLQGNICPCWGPLTHCGFDFTLHTLMVPENTNQLLPSLSGCWVTSGSRYLKALNTAKQAECCHLT